MTPEQKVFFLTDTHTREELQLLKANQDFYCPACKEKVVLKVGQIKIPHFSHTSHSECAGISEPESLLHLQGKRMLHQFFSNRHLPIEIEKYMPLIRQRTDLLVNHQTAVEFQCSPLSVDQLIKRTDHYQSLELDTIWIKGTKEVLKEGIQVFRLKAYEQAMLQKKGNNYYLLFFLPEKNCFFYFSNLLFVSGNRWIGKGKYLSADQQSFPFATPKRLTKEEFQKAWLLFSRLQRQFIDSQSYAKNRFQNPFWLSCYELQLDSRKLPDQIGLPLWQARCIAQPAVLWQLQVLLAERKGIKMNDLVRSGKLPLNEYADSQDVVRVLNSFLELYHLLKKKGGHPWELSDILYDIYCQNL